MQNASGGRELIYMDEVGTPDSSRIWDGAGYRDGKIVENSKEGLTSIARSRTRSRCANQQSADGRAFRLCP